MTREESLEQIIDLETEMFTQIKAMEAPPPNTLPAFKKMRWMTYSVLSDRTLLSWLNDLLAAKRYGRNVMTEKYALIADQIRPLQQNARIAEIVRQEMEWMRLIAEQYPNAIERRQENVELFERYALCELQTWSPASIELYWQDVESAAKAGRNLAEARYDNLYASIGKGTLARVEDEAMLARAT